MLIDYSIQIRECWKREVWIGEKIKNGVTDILRKLIRKLLIKYGTIRAFFFLLFLLDIWILCGVNLKKEHLHEEYAYIIQDGLRA